mgnify:FL=1
MTVKPKKEVPLLVSSEMLLGSREAAQELGIDILDSLRKYQIDPGLLTAPEGFLQRHQVISFLEDVARRFDCQQFGFLVGKHQPSLRLGQLEPIFKLSPNIKTAIENTLIYQPLYSEARVHQLVVEDGYANMIRWDPKMASGSAVQLNTLVIVQIFKILKALCGSSWEPTSVYFSHAAPAAKGEYRRFFQCPVYFNREFDGVVFPERQLHQKIATADARLLKIILTHYDRLMASRAQERDPGDLVAAVSSFIQRKLGTNLCNLQSCAQFFDMHPRALQRALAERDCTFKSLLSSVRMELARQYLRSSDMSVTELAELLGYRNLSAFTRAFHQAHAQSPAAWKSSMKGGDGHR